jgi:hypothetical protein
MCDKSILVLISSSPRNGRALRAEDDCASAEPRMWARTFSASWSSIELECVFFSVTPTSGSASRMALLFTSSSLARSFIRTFIRPFFSPALGIHRNLTEPILCTRTLSNLPARAIFILWFRERNLEAHALLILLTQFRGPRIHRKPLRLLRQPLLQLLLPLALPLQQELPRRRRPRQLQLQGQRNNYSPQD